MSQPCPPRSQLERLLLEQLDLVEDAELTRHIEGCESCQTALAELSGGRMPPKSSTREGYAPRAAEDATGTVEDVIRRLKEQPLDETLALRPGRAAGCEPSDVTFTLRAGAEVHTLPQVPGYEVLEEVGRGGMGVIYRARHLGLNRIVALKMLRSGAQTSVTALARLRAEASAIARLHHPNIVQIYEVGENAGQPYLSLEFVEGGSLRQRLDGTPRPARDAAMLLEIVARAVDAAHSRGIVHRDLKPANILLQHGEITNHANRNTKEKEIGNERRHGSALNPPGSGPFYSCYSCDSWLNGVPKVTDFGLAKLLDSDSAPCGPLTQTGEVVGTPNYMAPEQARGKGAIRPAADVYALGAVLYELLTGRPPFVAETPLDTLLRVVHEEPISATRLCPSLPRDLATVTMKCLEKDPARRYPTAGALADDLARFREGRAVRARPIGPAGRAGRWCRRNPVVAGLLAALALVFAAGFGAALWQAREARANADAEAQARAEADRQTELAIAGEKEATALRRQAERVAALSRLDQGILQCRQGELGTGLLLLADSLGKAERAGGDDLQHVIRCNLAAWVRHLLPTTASPAHGSALVAGAWAPDGRTVATGPVGNAWDKPGPAEVRLWEAATWKPVGPPLPHPYTVFGLAFRPDGRRLAVGGGDRVDPLRPGEVRVWDIATGKPVGEPLPHPAAVLAVAFGPDGKTLLTGCWDGKARLWDTGMAEPARLRAVLESAIRNPQSAMGGAVRAVAFSPDGQTVLTGGADHFARIWDATTGQLRVALPHAEEVLAVAFSPDGRRVLTGCNDHTARLWDAVTGQRLGSPMLNRHAVRAVAFHPTKSLLATGGGSRGSQQFGRGETRIWDATTMKPVGSPLNAGGIVRAVAFSPDGRSVLTATKDGRARVTDISRLHPLTLTILHAPDIRWVRFRPDGKALLTVSAPQNSGELWGEMRLWDPITGKPLGPSMPAHSTDRDGSGFIVHFSPDGRALLDGFLPRDAATGHALGPSPAEGTTSGYPTTFSPDGKLFFVLRDGAALLWDVATNKQVGAPLTHEKGVTAVAFHPDGKTFLTAGGDGTTCLWDLTTRRRISAPLRHEGPVNALAFSPDGQTFLTVDQENTVRQWETRIGRPLGISLRVPKEDQRAHFHSLRFSPDGQQIVLDLRPMLYVWDAATGQLLTSLRITDMVWAAGGKLLGLISGNLYVGVAGAIRLWDVERRQFRDLALPGTSRCLDVYPAGRLMATGDDEMAGLWDVATGRLVGPPFEHPAPLIALSFAPDGNRLLTCCGDEVARFWEVPRPLSGDVDRVRRWLEVLTGKELSDGGTARPLDGAELEQRRNRLKELGGPLDTLAGR